MDSILIIFILALSALLFIYLYYDRFKKEKKGKDLTSYIEGLKALLDGRDEAAFGKFREAVAEDTPQTPGAPVATTDGELDLSPVIKKKEEEDKK